MGTLKIGLLLDGRLCNKYIYELVCWAERQSDLEISDLVILGSVPAERAGTAMGGAHPGYPASSLLFRLIVMIERLILRFSSLHREHFDQIDLGRKIERQTTIEPLASHSRRVYRFAGDQVRRVEELGLDLLIAFGTDALQGEILGAARLGVIAVASAGNQHYRGGPAGFWECYYEHPKTGFVIQVLTDEKIRNVLLSGFFSTKFLFSLNQACLYRKINPHLQQLLKRIAASGRLPEIEVQRPYSGAVLHAPGFSQSLRYLLKMVRRISARAVFRIANYEKKWEISFVPSSWRKAILWNGIHAKAPRGHFWADPFLYARDGKTYCFVEDYVYKTDRAHISVLEVDQTGARRIGECIREPFHLSFPFVFHYGGELYMCPECSGSRQIRVYRCTGFPLRWELAAVAMENVSAADTMLFEHAGSWWMLTSIDQSGLNDYCSELYLFSADSPLATSWKAHPQNPIRIDSEGGRNAGMLFEDGKMFRLAQRQGYDQYGQGVLMYEITQLSGSAYAERQVSEINPFFKKGLLGVHHLSTAGQMTVFDHVSRSFVL